MNKSSIAPQSSSPQDWQQWFGGLVQPDVLREMAVLALAALLAWWLTHKLRRLWRNSNGLPPESDSILLGHRSYDGVLFPLLWLCFAWLGGFVLLRMGAKHTLMPIAQPMLLALLGIRMTVKVLRATLSGRTWVRSLEHTVSWLLWGALVLWITGFLPLLVDQLNDITWKVGATKISVGVLLQGLLAVGFVVLVTLWLSSLVEQWLLRSATGDALSLRKAASNVARALLLFVGVIVTLSVFGIDLTALSVFGGALGVGIGLGLQKLAANYVSGFVILAERSVRIGDTVRVDNFEGRITAINGRYTIIRSLTGVEAICPNEMLVTQRVENQSLQDRNLWLSSTIAVGYDSDVDLVQRLLMEAAQAQARVLHNPPPAANLENFGDNGLEFRLGFWIADPENGTGLLRSEINKHILQSLRAHGIDIPYPQRVLHQAQASANAEGQGPQLAR